jgi:hypothetical protein
MKYHYLTYRILQPVSLHILPRNSTIVIAQLLTIYQACFRLYRNLQPCSKLPGRPNPPFLLPAVFVEE